MRDKSGWDVSAPLLWGYFFTDTDEDRLDKAAHLLIRQGYRFVDVWLPDKDAPEEQDLWWLHVERVEHHTVDTLVDRNAALNGFAAANGLVSYDGMDVGPIKGAGSTR